MYLSTSKLMGGLGNYLFQISAAYSLSLRDDKEYVCDISDEQKAHNSVSHYSKNILRKLKFVNGITNFIPIGQSAFSFEELPRINSNTKLFGYFQSEKFFLNHREQVLDLFEIDEFTKNYLYDKYKKELALDNCSLHVRRGDYLGLPNHHPTQSPSYYKESVEMIGPEKHFLIFSDDIFWCKKNFDFIPNKTFVCDNQDYQELYLMSLCKNNIICNSTFSWWGAWLNTNEHKKIISPKKWFGSSNLHLETKDLYCDKWIVI